MMNKRDLTSPFYFARILFRKCPGVCLPGRRCQISSHYIIPYSFCQVKRFFKFFSANFFSPLSSLCAPALASNFMRCQILINQLRSSYASCQILKQLQNQLQNNSLYLYFPFYYNTNFNFNQAAKAVKFSRANLKRFKL